MTHRHEVSKGCWENGAERRGRGAATRPQRVKHAAPAEHNGARSACTYRDKDNVVKTAIKTVGNSG